MARAKMTARKPETAGKRTYKSRSSVLITKRKSKKAKALVPNINKAERLRKVKQLKKIITSKLAIPPPIDNMSFFQQLPSELRLIIWSMVFEDEVVEKERLKNERALIAALRPDEMSYWEILHIFYSKRNMTLNTHTFHQFYHEMSTDALKLVTRLVVDLDYPNGSSKYRSFFTHFRHPRLAIMENVQFLRIDFVFYDILQIGPFVEKFLKMHDYVQLLGIRMRRFFRDETLETWWDPFALQWVIIDLDNAKVAWQGVNSVLGFSGWHVVTKEEFEGIVEDGDGWDEYAWGDVNGEPLRKIQHPIGTVGVVVERDRRVDDELEISAESKAAWGNFSRCRQRS